MELIECEYCGQRQLDTGSCKFCGAPLKKISTTDQINNRVNRIGIPYVDIFSKFIKEIESQQPTKWWRIRDCTKENFWGTSIFICPKCGYKQKYKLEKDGKFWCRECKSVFKKDGKDHEINDRDFIFLVI